MTISERTLKKWRREALQHDLLTTDERLHELLGKILRMTQELLDQHLLRK